MNRRAWGFLAALLTALSAPVAAFEWQYAVDGDSVQGSGSEQARLLCIDAPELHQRGGKEAKQALQNLLNDGVDIKKRGKDIHRRHLVLITDAQGASINMEMIRQGQAWVLDRYAHNCGLPPDALYAAQDEAKAARRGLWRDPNPQEPWQWRRQNPRD